MAQHIHSLDLNTVMVLMHTSVQIGHSMGISFSSTHCTSKVAIESGGVASSHRKFPPLAPALILFYRGSVHAVIEVINVNHSVDTEDGMHSRT